MTVVAVDLPADRARLPGLDLLGLPPPSRPRALRGHAHADGRAQPGYRASEPILRPKPDVASSSLQRRLLRESARRPPARDPRLPAGRRLSGADRRPGGAARVCDLPLRDRGRERLLADPAADRARRGPARARGRERWLRALRPAGRDPCDVRAARPPRAPDAAGVSRRAPREHAHGRSGRGRGAGRGRPGVLVRRLPAAAGARRRRPRRGARLGAGDRSDPGRDPRADRPDPDRVHDPDRPRRADPDAQALAGAVAAQLPLPGCRARAADAARAPPRARAGADARARRQALPLPRRWQLCASRSCPRSCSSCAR